MRECANGMPRPCRGRDAAWPCKGGDPPSAWRRSRSARTPLPRRCANGMPRPCGRGCRMALQRRQPTVSMATISVSSHAAAARGQLFETKAGFLRTLLPARKYRPCSGEAVQAARHDFAGSASPVEAALISEMCKPQRVLPRLRFPCGSGGYCAARRTGARFFVRFPCGSSVCCAARRTAGRGSSSALLAEAVLTARPAPALRRRPPRWRAWPEGSCPSAHPASSRASPRPSR